MADKLTENLAKERRRCDVTQMNRSCVLPALGAVTILLGMFAQPALAVGKPNQIRGDAIQGTKILLCAPANTTAAVLSADLLVVRRRVHHGFHFHHAPVRQSSQDCISVKLTHSIRWLKWLATDIAGVGRFGLGVTVPSASKPLNTGDAVRYQNDPVTSANSTLPKVRVVVGRPGLKGYTAKYERMNGYDYVGVDLTPSGSHKLCSFTKTDIGKLAVVVLDRRVVSDEAVSQSICSGSMLTGFPVEHSLDRPLGPREIIADLHSGLLPLQLSVTSLQ